MKKFLLMIAGALALPCVSGYAASDYLHVRTDSGWTVLNLNEVDRLTFNAGTVGILDIDKKQVASFPQSSLDFVYVDDNMESNESASINAVLEEGVNFTYNSASKSVLVQKEGRFDIYKTDGSLIVGIPEVKAGETIDISGIEPGIVIINSGNQSIKVIL